MGPNSIINELRGIFFHVLLVTFITIGASTLELLELLEIKEYSGVGGHSTGR